MTKQLRLPQPDESVFEIEIGDKKIVCDIVELDSMHYQAAADRDKYDPNATLHSYFAKLFADRYGVKISNYGVQLILDAKADVVEDIKKKYDLSSGPENTSDSGQETNESSGSSDSSSQN